MKKDKTHAAGTVFSIQLLQWFPEPSLLYTRAFLKEKLIAPAAEEEATVPNKITVGAGTSW